MELTKKETENIIRDSIQKELFRIQVKGDLPELKERKFEIKQVELIDIVGYAVRKGIELYGAYHFGKFLAKIGYKVTNRNLR